MKNLLAKRVKKNNKGFTLVELIIVIAIIAILVAVLAPNYVRYVDRSRWSSDQNESSELLSEVKTAIVDAQNDDKVIKDFSIEIPSSGKTDFAKGTDTATQTAIKQSLDNNDPKWQSLNIKHKNQQEFKSDGTTYEVPGSATYTITYKADNGKVEGTWNGAKAKS